MYADDLGANHALALDPQFSIDPEKAPYRAMILLNQSSSQTFKTNSLIAFMRAYKPQGVSKCPCWYGDISLLPE
ncbi:MAG: hypothetical protein ACSHWY_04235 [Octadecabacter sp.]